MLRMCSEGSSPAVREPSFAVIFLRDDLDDEEEDDDSEVEDSDEEDEDGDDLDDDGYSE